MVKFYIYVVCYCGLFNRMILRWCKWYGAAWLASHFITSINPVDIGSILFIVETIISICATLMSMSKNKEQKSN